MKVLIVNTTDISGGAARAAIRLHSALLNEGVQSEMLVQSKLSDNDSVYTRDGILNKVFSKLRPTLDSLPLYKYRDKRKSLFSTAWFPSRIVKNINAANPDIVHLHWINSGMIPISELSRIKAPVVWSLHDMWPFTGGCHYDAGCDKYQNECGSCPILMSSKNNDISRKIIRKKLNVFKSKEEITVVGLSKWLADCARKSAVFKNENVINLPNPIDTNQFKSIDKEVARDILNLPQDKRLVLFGAINATGDARKGFKELSSAIQLIDNDNVELFVFGSSTPKESQNFNRNVHYLGHIYDDVTLRIVYSAADVMVVPSLQENLSNTIMESMACGTPVVAFDIGGNRDLIDHQINGYLSKPYDSMDLARGINWVINNVMTSSELSVNSVNKIKTAFDEKIVVKKYIDLYKEITEK